MKLPNSIFERIGTVAAGILSFFIEKGYLSNKSDEAMWNIISFITAFLVEFNICTVVNQIHIQLGFKNMYDNEDERFNCDVWIREGVTFYRKQIKNMRSERHSLPDVTVYNLLNPSLDKIDFDNLPIFGTDVFVMTECWSYILDIFDVFFLNDDNIKDLPLGC